MVFPKKELARLTGSEVFLWATGIEDTFVTAPHPKTGRILDEYALTQHYDRWKGDLALIQELGVTTARYGVPWHRINPSPGKWDWKWADEPLHHLLELGIDPIVDLVHYGLPSWIENAYLNADYPHWVAEYSSRLAQRFKGRIFYYTPLNEPRITAWYCGRLGWWPPFAKGWSGFVRVLVGVCEGIVRTVQAMESIDPEIVPVHVDATDLFETADPDLQEEADRRQSIVFLALDIITGKVTEEHSLFKWLLSRGATVEKLAWFQANAISMHFLGINLYPMFSRKILLRRSTGLRVRMPYAEANIIDELGQLYWNRYRAPLFISETASVGSISRRRNWLNDSVEAVARLRRKNIPMVGYTWWPLFALVTWGYRQGNHAPEYYLKQMGLWDLDAGPEGSLDRIRTELVDHYQRLVSGGIERVGPLRTSNQLTHVS